jgi:PRTRC genetic system protein F
MEPVGGQRNGMTDAELSKVACTTSDQLVSQILEAIDALGKQGTPTADLHSRAREDGGEFVGYCALVRYSEDDQTEGLAEYLCNYAMESGESYEVVLSVPVSQGETEALRDVLGDVGAWLDACGLLDRLMWLLSGADSVYGGEGT